jgi:hypothetical protein
MKIDRMKKGKMYLIKPETIIDIASTGSLSSPDYLVLKGWRKWDHSEPRPPFIYLGYAHENWTYNYQATNKVHYAFWKGSLYVMDNQFAKHVVPLEDTNG